MDHAKRGADALAAGNFSEAIECYTKAITSSPTSPDYFIKRSTAYQRSSPADHSAAFSDANNAVLFAQQRAKRELIVQAQLRRAIALFGLERYGDARFVLSIVKRMDDKDNSLALWSSKINSKLDGVAEDDPKCKVTVTETPSISDPAADELARTSSSTTQSTSSPHPITAPAQTPADKIKHTWYQTSDAVSFTLFVKSVPKEQATILIESQSLAITFPLVNGSLYNLAFDPLFGPVNVTDSKFDITSTKIEVTLRKAQPGHKWQTLEGAEAIDATLPASASAQIPQAPPKPAASAPAYPTSSRNGPKDWDKLATDLTSSKKDKKSNSGDNDDEDDYDYEKEEGDDTNAFFKKLYAGASPDVRRAMMKSFTESNGTALSTNWEDVGKKKVDVSPPDGMEAKKWEA